VCADFFGVGGSSPIPGRKQDTFGLAYYYLGYSGDFKDVAVIEVLVKPGDAIKQEQSLITVESDSTGRFTGQLPPGTYSVTASTGHVNDGNSPCSQALTTRVQAGKTVTLSLVCAVP